MTKNYDFSRDPMTCVGVEEGDSPIKLILGADVLEGFNATVKIRLGDLPPSVLAALWHDTEFENDASFRETVAQVFFDNCGQDIADYYSKMIERVKDEK